MNEPSGHILPLSCFSVRIASVAFGLLRGFIVSVARATVLLSLLACCIVSLRSSVDFHLLQSCTLVLFKYCPRPLCLPLVSCSSYSQTLFLPCNTVWFCGFLRVAVGLKAISFSIASGAPAIGKIVVSFVSHVSVPFGVSSFWSSDLLRTSLKTVSTYATTRSCASCAAFFQQRSSRKPAFSAPK